MGSNRIYGIIFGDCNVFAKFFKIFLQEFKHLYTVTCANFPIAMKYTFYYNFNMNDETTYLKKGWQRITPMNFANNKKAPST